MDELDKKVYRVLSLKYEYGMFTTGSLWHESPEEAIRAPEVALLSKAVARRSILMLKDGQNALPIPGDGRMLVVEQINKTPNDIHWHPGLLYKHCMKYNRGAEYLETEYTYDNDDKEAILANAGDYGTLVFTNFFIRGKLSNNEFLSELIKKYPQKRIVIVVNTPYPLCIPEGASSVVLTLSTGPDSIEAVAGVLFGAVTAEGEYPIEYRL
jgi:beta-N-acetylhexosaminidase